MIRLRPNLNSIATRLIIFGVAVLLVGATGRLLVLGHYLRDSLVESASARLDTLAVYAARDIALQLEQRRNLLTRLANHIAIEFPFDPADTDRELRNTLVEWNTINPLFSQGLVLLSPLGVEIARTSIDAVESPLARSDIVYRTGDSTVANIGDNTGNNTGRITIGTPFLDPRSKTPLLPIMAPVVDTEGSLRAYLVGLSALDGSGVLRTLHGTPEESGTATDLILVVPESLALRADVDGFGLVPFSEAGITPIKNRTLTNNPVRIELISDDTLDVIHSVPGSDWALIARLPSSEVYLPQTKLGRFILHNTGILLIIVPLVITFGIRYLLGPLRHAAAHADRMTRDEIPLAPLPVVRNDEVGHLTQAFNRVLDKLLDSQEELQHMAHRDPLTGLPNRHLLSGRMAQAIVKAQRQQGRVALLFLDLDQFKPINDRLGHDAGDLALQQVATRLQGVLRRADTLARVGGDEFVILLTDLGLDAKDAARIVARKCLDTFEQEFDIKGQSCRLGTSIGIAVGDGDCDPDMLLIAADRAMYRSKLSRRGEIHWSTPGSADPDAAVTATRSERPPTKQERS